MPEHRVAGMTEESGRGPRKRDWRISAVLLVIWLVALMFLARSETDIPVSMLVIATVFFVILIPSMNDLVSSLDRFFGSDQSATDTSAEDRN
jgi:hypothetical protein